MDAMKSLLSELRSNGTYKDVADDDNQGANE